jgi:lipoprotein-anchoring transpeptidase ErfK/SrfK
MKTYIAFAAAAFLAAMAPAAAMTAKNNFAAAEDAAPKKKKKIAVIAKKPAKPNAARAERKAPVQVCTNFFQCIFSSSGGTHHGTNGGTDRATRQSVAFDTGKYAPGTIIIRTPERALYYVLGDGKAYRYSVGVGREGFQWSGASRIIAKQEWPEWHPPEEMIAREAAKGHMLPDMMEGGPENPLGARAMYIGGTLFRIHGTNNPSSIGGAVSSGCIRMMNIDVVDLYGRVKIGTRVVVTQ